MNKNENITMNEEQLEKMAIAELLREAEAHSQDKQLKEPKINKLVPPNKQFLGRTLNSVMTHNKRENERLQRNCRSKLKALEERRRQRLLNKERSESSTDVKSSSDSDIQFVSMAQNKRTKQSKQKHKSSVLQTKHKRRKNYENFGKEEEAQRLQYAREEYYAKHFNELAAYALASESYNQVGKWLCYQALLAGTYDSYDMPYNLEDPMQSGSAFQDYTISISSDDEIKHELDLDSDLGLGLELWPNSTKDMNNSISLEADHEVHSDSETLLADALELTLKESQLIDDELAILKACEPYDLQTIELSDSSDNEDTNIPQSKKLTNDSIDLTSD